MEREYIVLLEIGINVAGISNSAVHKIFHFTALPKDPTAYFDPKTGEYHSSKSSSNNGTTSSGGTQNSNGNSASTDTKTSENATATGQQIVEEAEKYIGKLPYVWGGCSLETGADCSGFCWAILKKLGLYSGGRITTIGFETAGTEVPSLSEAQAGDMIVYGPGKGQSYHMAIYDGHGGIIHEADEQEDCKHGTNAAFAKILTIRRFTNYSGTATVTSDNTETKKSIFKVKVATWQENTQEIVSTDTSENKKERNYYMNEITIPYQNIVAQYRMPFNYLWTMLIYSQDKKFTFDLADLVRNSQIEITIHDNLQETTTNVTESYTQEFHYSGHANIKMNYKYTSGANSTNPQQSSVTSNGSVTRYGSGSATSTEKYKKTTTTIDKVNTPEVWLTLADTWCVKYERKYKYNGESTTNSESKQKIDDVEIDGEPEYNITNSALLSKIKSSAKASAGNILNSTSATITSSKVVSGTALQTVDSKIIYNPTVTKVKTKTTSYTGEPENFHSEEKPKFAIVFNKHYNARSNIISAKEWLFDALESNADTANMVDLTKYLMYKATGKSYGVTTYNFKAYNPSDFLDLNGGTIEGNTTEERVWLALINAGFNDVAAAAAMGNLSLESGGSGNKKINTDVVEGGYTENNGGIGMCQWTNNNRGSEGRNTQLRKYAQSKGKTWKDEETQIEFLITEITGQGKAKGYASYQFMDKTYAGATYPADAVKNVENDPAKIDYATRAFAATFERPSEAAFISSMAKRIELAQYFYSQFKGKRATGTGGTGSFSLEHAIKVTSDAHSKQHQNLKWHGSIVGIHAGMIGAYVEAINILNGTNISLLEVYNKIMSAHPEQKYKNKPVYENYDINDFYHISVSRAPANITEIKKALSQGKLVAEIVNTTKWRDEKGRLWGKTGRHTGLIFYFDGTYYHMKTTVKLNAIYTEKQLIEWLGNTKTKLIIYSKK